MLMITPTTRIKKQLITFHHKRVSYGGGFGSSRRFSLSDGNSCGVSLGGRGCTCRGVRRRFPGAVEIVGIFRVAPSPTDHRIVLIVT